jgi:hypothetical protein
MKSSKYDPFQSMLRKNESDAPKLYFTKLYRNQYTSFSTLRGGGGEGGGGLTEISVIIFARLYLHIL